ncbi:uncharacterized protein TNCV_1830971 [Trichonephila clavipes]|nr:uncharacterized protein TNCV_1830971 [Trichonephila clavipes]
MIFLRGRIIGRLECGRTQLGVSEELGIAQSVISRLWRRFQDDGVAFLSFWTVKTVLNPISGQVFDEGQGDSGVLYSAKWHDGDWLIDGIREAWLRCFVWMKKVILHSGSQKGPYGSPGFPGDKQGVHEKLKMIWGSMNNVRGPVQDYTGRLLTLQEALEYAFCEKIEADILTLPPEVNKFADEENVNDD